MKIEYWCVNCDYNNFLWDIPSEIITVDEFEKRLEEDHIKNSSDCLFQDITLRLNVK